MPCGFPVRFLPKRNETNSGATRIDETEHGLFIQGMQTTCAPSEGEPRHIHGVDFRLLLHLRDGKEIKPCKSPS